MWFLNLFREYRQAVDDLHVVRQENMSLVRRNARLEEENAKLRERTDSLTQKVADTLSTKLFGTPFFADDQRPEKAPESVEMPGQKRWSPKPIPIQDLRERIKGGSRGN